MSKLSPFTQRRGNIVYFRVAVPNKLRQTLGVREIIKSLNTQDKTAVMPVVLMMAAATKQFFNRLALMSEKKNNLDLVLLKARHSLAINDLKEQHDQETRKLIDSFHKELELTRLTTKSDVLSMVIKESRYSSSSEPGVEPVVPSVSVTERVKKHSLTELIPIWERLRKPAKSSVQVYTSAIKTFMLKLPSASVESITRKDIQDYIASRQESGSSASTIAKEYAAVRSLLTIAVDQGWIGTNVASGIILPKVRRMKKRGYTLEELQLIFDSPVFTKGERPAKGKGSAAFWMPLIMLYTGARREEVARLRTASIVTIEGFHAIKFEEVDDETFKTTGSTRTVPVHEELINLGFIDYVGKCSVEKQELLFPLLKKNKLDHYAGKWGDWWRGYIRNDLKVTDPRIMPAHSFRHGFITECRRTAMRTDFERALVGHTDHGHKKDAHDDYGDIPFKTLKYALDKVAYKDLNLSALVP